MIRISPKQLWVEPLQPVLEPLPAELFLEYLAGKMQFRQLAQKALKYLAPQLLLL
jgi:hypothetical protein